MSIESIRKLIRDNPRTPDGYSQEVRDAVGRYAQRRRDEGAPWSQIEVEVGVSATSIRTWMLALPAAGFQQVVVVDDPPGDRLDERGFVLTSPSGFTLTGCTLDQAAALLQRLR